MLSPIHHLGCFLPKSFPSRRLRPTRACLCLVALNGERVSIHANPSNQALAHPIKQCCLVEQPLSPSSTNSRECDTALKYFAVWTVGWYALCFLVEKQPRSLIKDNLIVNVVLHVPFLLANTVNVAIPALRGVGGFWDFMDRLRMFCYVRLSA